MINCSSTLRTINMQDQIPYIIGGLTSASAFTAQVQPDTSGLPALAIQAGMAGVVVLLLLKFFPMILNAMKAEADANRKIVREIVEANHAKDAAWQRIVSENKLCTKNKNGD